MENNLFPSGYEEEIITEEDRTSQEPTGYRNGIAYDDQTGDYVRDGKNIILDSTGIESWKSWCFNCLNTERYAHLAYSTDFGIETAAAFAATSREEAESILTRTITEALLADPYQRTKYVDDIEFVWSAPDSVEAKVSIQGIEGVSIDVVAYLTRGEK